MTARRTSALRCYEQIGLLPAAIRVNGRRRYRRDVIRVLAVIETAQRTGLTLDEVKALLQAGPAIRLRLSSCARSPSAAVLVVQIERATIVHAWLEAASRCECPDLDGCPLFDATVPLPPA